VRARNAYVVLAYDWSGAGPPQVSGAWGTWQKRKLAEKFAESVGKRCPEYVMDVCWMGRKLVGDAVKDLTR